MTRHSKIFKEIRELAHKLFSNIPGMVYLYGSQARGDAAPDSDWDILIVTDAAIDKQTAYENYAYPFTEIGWRLGAQITPLLYTRSEWNAESNTAFYHNVNNDAILL